jgi:hypothetical protein
MLVSGVDALVLGTVALLLLAVARVARSEAVRLAVLVAPAPTPARAAASRPRPSLAARVTDARRHPRRPRAPGTD